MGHQYIAVRQTNGTGLAKFQEGENLRHFCVFDNGYVGFPNAGHFFQLPAIAGNICDAGIDSGTVRIPADCMKGQHPCAIKSHDKGCLTTDTGGDRTGEGLTIIVREMQMIGQPLAGLHIFVPANHHQSTVF